MRFIFIFFSLLSIIGCSKEERFDATVTTKSVENVGPISATLGGNIVNGTEFEITEKGVCWGLANNPTIDDFSQAQSFFKDSSEFTRILTGLDLNTKYYARAYVKIGEEIIYGQQISFTTANEYFSDQGTFTDVRDGTEYKWVEIGSQTWMAENLKYFENPKFKENMFYVYGYGGELDQFGFPDDYDFDYAKTLENYTIFGLIYDLNSLSPSCPEGWRIPTHEEWYKLINYLGGLEVAGKHLKSIDASLWEIPNNATDFSNFSALPGGHAFLSPNGNFEFRGLGTSTNFWGLDGNNPEGHEGPILVSLNNASTAISLSYTIRYYLTGYCRCIKD